MPEKILRLPAVKSLTGLSRSTIYLWVEGKSFPEPINLGTRAVGWVESEITQWIDQRIKRSRLKRLSAVNQGALRRAG